MKNTKKNTNVYDYTKEVDRIIASGKPIHEQLVDLLEMVGGKVVDVSLNKQDKSVQDNDGLVTCPYIGDILFCPSQACLKKKQNKKLNTLIDEMGLIERYAIEFGKSKSAYKEKLLGIHKDRFYKLINKIK